MTVAFGNGVSGVLRAICCHTRGLLRSVGKLVHNTYQLTDEEGPGLPADFIGGEDLSGRYD